MKSAHPKAALLLVLVLALAGCVTNPSVPYSAGASSIDVDPTRRGPVAGVGIEGHDINSMAEEMIRDMLGDPDVMTPGKTVRPRVVIDSQCFKNEGSQAINKNSITRTLANLLTRAAKRQFQFVSQEDSAAVELQRDLKRSGATDMGTRALTKAVSGVDYQLCGNITTLDSRNVRTGMVQRDTRIFFRLIDSETTDVVWSNQYNINRAAADDVVYR
jgi:penicillin-binding protein activator